MELCHVNEVSAWVSAASKDQVPRETQPREALCQVTAPRAQESSPVLRWCGQSNGCTQTPWGLYLGTYETQMNRSPMGSGKLQSQSTLRLYTVPRGGLCGIFVQLL